MFSHNCRASVHTIWALKDFLSLLQKYSSCEKGVLEIVAAAAGSATLSAMLSDLSLDALERKTGSFLYLLFAKSGERRRSG
jgi:hypothetical protein